MQGESFGMLQPGMWPSQKQTCLICAFLLSEEGVSQEVQSVIRGGFQAPNSSSSTCGLGKQQGPRVLLLHPPKWQLRVAAISA